MEGLRKKFSADRTLYDPQMMGGTKFGSIHGIEVGKIFPNRKACLDAGVHTAPAAGIAYSKDGASSICLSHGYEDDKDEGDFIVYTGTGGQENSFSGTGEQIADQTFDHKHNAALMKSGHNKIQVRVVRGPNENSIWAPEQGYRYDGLYIVEKSYKDKGKSGYDVCKFDLRRVPGQPPIPKKSPPV